MPQDLTQVDLRKLDLARATVAGRSFSSSTKRWPAFLIPRSTRSSPCCMRMNARGVAIVMIEHIMRAVTSFSQRLVVLVAGRKIADGDPDEVLANDDVQRAYLGE